MTMSEQNSKKLEVLVIDDEEFRDVLAEIINDLGANATTAEDGQEGLEEYERRYRSGDLYDIVITDLSMPQLDGNDVLKRVKELSPQTPVILITGYEDTADYRQKDARRKEAELEHLSPDMVLKKPVKMHQIKEILEIYAIKAVGSGNPSPSQL